MFLKFYPLTFLLLSLIRVSSENNCNFSSNVPADGDCDGPLNRSLNSRETAVIGLTNNGCAINQVPYNPDNDLTIFKCGQCDPTEVDSMGVNPNCPIGSVCADSGECVYAEEYELYDAPCPGGSYLQWCGVLTCINRKCVQCIEGAKYGSAICLNGIYRADTFALFVGDPNMWIGALCIGVFVISSFSTLIYVGCKNKKLKRTLLNNGNPQMAAAFGNVSMANFNNSNQSTNEILNAKSKMNEQEQKIDLLQSQLSTLLTDMKASTDLRAGKSKTLAGSQFILND